MGQALRSLEEGASLTLERRREAGTGGLQWGELRGGTAEVRCKCQAETAFLGLRLQGEDSKRAISLGGRALKTGTGHEAELRAEPPGDGQTGRKPLDSGA